MNGNQQVTYALDFRAGRKGRSDNKALSSDRLERTAAHVSERRRKTVFGTGRRFLGKRLFAIVSGPPRPPNDNAIVRSSGRVRRNTIPIQFLIR